MSKSMLAYLRNYLSNPELKRFLRETEAGQYLFKQGEMGNTLIVLVSGIVQLFDESSEVQHLVGTYGPGQFFGEKAILKGSGHQRFYSAFAQIKTTYLEITRNDLELIQRVVPDFWLHMFQAAAQRLDRAYYLIRLLRSHDDMERLIHAILYFYRCPGLTVTAGSYIPLTADDVCNLLNMDKGQVEICLNQLADQKILVKRPNDCYLLRDEKALLESLSQYEKKAA